MNRTGLRAPDVTITGRIGLLLAVLLSATPARGEDEMLVKLIEAVVPAAAQPEVPPPSLQDIFVFGELGVPAGHPGSFVLTPADEAGLEAAIAHSRGPGSTLRGPARPTSGRGGGMPQHIE